MHPVSPGSELVQGQESKNLPVTEMSLGHFVTDATTTTICFFNVTVQRMQRQHFDLGREYNPQYDCTPEPKLQSKVACHTPLPLPAKGKTVYQKH